MADAERANKAINQLADAAAQLRRWAACSLDGSWSTHLVGPMRAYADRIDEVLYRIGPPCVVSTSAADRTLERKAKAAK